MMGIDSARVHLRNISLLGAGAALLAVIGIGYFLMKSDRKKPKRRSSKSLTHQEVIDLVLDNESNNNTPISNDLKPENTNPLLESYSLISTETKTNDDFVEEVEHEIEEESDHSKEKEQTHSMSELDKLSDISSSDSGNGQSDIVQMYNCINEYDEFNTNLTSSKLIDSNSTDDESNLKSISKEASPAPVSQIEVVTQQTSSNTPVEFKGSKSKSSSSSSSSASTSSFQTTIPKSKSKGNKNSKINFESKKYKNNQKNGNGSEKRIEEKTRRDSTSSNSTTRSSNTTKTASLEDLVVYEFNFPRKYCGKLIGKNGVHVDYIRSKTHTQIAVRNDPHVEDLQVVCVSGRIEDVDAALDIISMRFPAQLYPQISFKPISKPIVYRRFNPEKKSLFEQSKVLVASNMFVQIADVIKTNNKSVGSLPPQSASSSNELNTAISKPIELNAKFSAHLTAVVNATHVFIQLPTHTSYENLKKLDECMVKAYSDTNEPVPNMSEPIEYGTICAAPTSYGWHRAMVTSYQPHDEASSMLSLGSLNIGDDFSSLTSGIATVKFLDYGGYLNIPANQLKQLRSDFMLLPFQAIECYLDGIFPYDGTEESGKAFLSHMIKNSMTEAAVTGYSDENIPLIKLYISNDSAKDICLNNELEKYGLVYNTFGNDLHIHSENNSLDHYFDSYTSLPYSSINDQFSI